MTIDPALRLGPVRLRGADLEQAQAFYERALGLATLDPAGEEEVTTLGLDDSVLIELHADPDAPPRPRRSTGLFHIAILVPDRVELARSLRRVIDAGWRFTGAADHLVSEALYLDDPEGNGLEIYRDRPRDQWRHRDGQIEMATLPLDLEDVLAEAAGKEATERIASGTKVGHVHLNVADLGPTEDFYAGRLGLDVTTRDLPGALFLAAGGYHHHIGTNTWAGEGAPPPPPGSRGLEHFEIVVPSAEALPAAAPQASDPAGNLVRLRAS